MSSLVIFDHFHESGHGGRDEHGSMDTLTVNGIGSSRVVTLEHYHWAQNHPGKERADTEKYQIDGALLARLIMAHGQKV